MKLTFKNVIKLIKENKDLINFVLLLVSALGFLVGAYFSAQSNYYTYQNYLFHRPDIVPVVYSCASKPWEVIGQPPTGFGYSTSFTFTNDGGLGSLGVVNITAVASNNVNFSFSPDYENLSISLPPSQPLSEFVTVTANNKGEDFNYTFKAETNNNCYQVSCYYNGSGSFVKQVPSRSWGACT